MPTIEHSVLPNADLHEPKGASAASDGAVYVANGAGSGVWRGLSCYGGWRYSDVATGTTFTTPTSYTLMNVASTSTNLKQFTNNATGRLTYGASSDRIISGAVNVAFNISAGTPDVYFAVYKNGSILSAESFVYSPSSTTVSTLSMNFDDLASTNDYYEVYLKAASGNVVVRTAYVSLLGVPQ